jgi:hypothetical protein
VLLLHLALSSDRQACFSATWIASGWPVIHWEPTTGDVCFGVGDSVRLALVAVWLPAARALRVTPMKALRTEQCAMAEICPPKRIEPGRGGRIIPVLLRSNPRRED